MKIGCLLEIKAIALLLLLLFWLRALLIRVPLEYSLVRTNDSLENTILPSSYHEVHITYLCYPYGVELV